MDENILVLGFSIFHRSPGLSFFNFADTDAAQLQGPTVRRGVLTVAK